MYTKYKNIFIVINKVETVKTIPVITGISSVLIELTISFPMPFHPKIYSTKTEPASIEANHPEIAVTTGLREFFIACL